MYLWNFGWNCKGYSTKKYNLHRVRHSESYSFSSTLQPEMEEFLKMCSKLITKYFSLEFQKQLLLVLLLENILGVEVEREPYLRRYHRILRPHRKSRPWIRILEKCIKSVLSKIIHFFYWNWHDYVLLLLLMICTWVSLWWCSIIIVVGILLWMWIRWVYMCLHCGIIWWWGTWYSLLKISIIWVWHVWR